MLSIMASPLPNGIEWADTVGQLVCAKCGKQASMTGDGGETTRHFKFFAEHAACVADHGLKSGNSMNIREVMATQLLAAILTYRGHSPAEEQLLAQRAVSQADSLIAALASTKKLTPDS